MHTDEIECFGKWKLANNFKSKVGMIFIIQLSFRKKFVIFESQISIRLKWQL